jgi:XTP/dITP diphosphohydrolase
MKLILATSNIHKLAEFRSMVPAEFEFVSLSEIGFTQEIPETGSSFNDNALQKADFIYNLYKQTVIADDSGLQVDSLSGEPGVFSARYSGKGATDQQNIDKLMFKMNGLEDRRARFVASIALIINGISYLFEGVCEGKIALTQSGQGGFGYDPVFIPNGFDSTFADLSQEVKIEVGHRGRAGRQLIAFLKTIS